jgi:O-antigen/teichoic acid export membrane protein
MVFLLTYANAALSLLLIFGLARLMGPQSFSAVALGLTAGGFAAVLVNLGSDQAQMATLLQLDDAPARRRLALRHLRVRGVLMLVLAILLGAYLAWGQRGLTEGSCALTFGLWAASIGLQPNAYVDYLHAQARQQHTVLVERIAAIAAAAGIFWAEGDDLSRAGAWVGTLLLSMRLISTGWQWRQVLRLDPASRSETDVGHSSPRSSGSTDGQARSVVGASGAGATAASVFNAITAYAPVLALDVHGLRADLSLYSLCLQALNFVVLFQGTATRLVARRVMSHDGKPGSRAASQRLALREGGRILAASVLLALFGGLCTWAYVSQGLGMRAVADPLLVISVLFAWGAWMGLGQVVSRSLLSHGHTALYVRATGITTLVALTAASVLVSRWGAMGSALSVAIPHSLMIAFCAMRLASESAEVRS